MSTTQQALIAISIACLVYLYFKYKKGVGQELIIAAIISFAWVSWSGLYNYRDANTILLGVNVFTFVLWTTGFVVFREIYERMNGKNRFLLASGIWVAGMIVVEYVGYNYLGIQLSSCYPGLFGLPIMHVPHFAQLYYLGMGPAFLKITDWVGVK